MAIMSVEQVLKKLPLVENEEIMGKILRFCIGEEVNMKIHGILYIPLVSMTRIKA